MALRGSLAIVLLAASLAVAAKPSGLAQLMQRQAASLAHRWNMSVSLAFYQPQLAPSPVLASAGSRNAGLHLTARRPVPSRPDDRYVWGSTTKMFTAAAVLQLVDKGIVRLADPIGAHVDPLLRAAGLPVLTEKLGPAAAQISVRELLHMTSGVGDYDRGNYSRDQFASPGRDFSPLEILSEYVPGELEYPPGSAQDYCSTDYILLGLLLARHLGDGKRWQSYGHGRARQPA